MTDTIFARSTAPGRSGVAVIRISGPESWAAIEGLTLRAVPPPRRLVLRDLRWGEDLLDRALVVVFAADASFTGEESAELHLHGSEAVVRAVSAWLADVARLRPARPGDFTRRALEHDRLDLAEVEGLSVLLQAETEAQRRQAIAVVSGRFRARVEAWRTSLVAALATLEVTVDFADEDVPENLDPTLGLRLRSLADELVAEAEGVSGASKIAAGFEVAIVGAPNAGKSTLLNALAGRDAAITSESAGTTRDVIEVRMEIAGHLVTLLDTAGIREAEDLVEQAGVDRARARADAADLRVFMDRVPDGIHARPDDIIVRGKADLGVSGSKLAVSGLTGLGVTDLLTVIGTRLSDRVSGARLALSDRQEVALRRGAQALGRGADVLEMSLDSQELVAEDVRSAIAALDEVVGRVSPDMVLGHIFSEFCIGK